MKEIKTMIDEKPSRPLKHELIVEEDGSLTIDLFWGEWKATRPLERYDTPFVLEEIQRKKQEIEILKQHLRRITTTRNITIEKDIVRDEYNNKDIEVTRIKNIHPEDGTIQTTMDDY